ncbi:hypothetical protein CBP31_14755 [Oceanisphaera profunda]|uniref:Uncharacterized protein n=1 Tax=Oceanisphaera profunda TaxID=1416627 RepID=A0A1Y0D853_9GAMM|nr:DUF6172 family protein [Oceanisphaera profunda]ART83740.1 hypothetical protein CBP31_14755 [Oceanisphaera profunda]
MKKTFALAHPKLPLARRVDSIKYEIKKYLKRERNKTLPSGMNYWAFDCRFGTSAETATDVFPSEINKHIDAVVAQELPEFYVEILARACKHDPRAMANTEDDQA